MVWIFNMLKIINVQVVFDKKLIYLFGTKTIKSWKKRTIFGKAP